MARRSMTYGVMPARVEFDAACAEPDDECGKSVDGLGFSFGNDPRIGNDTLTGAAANLFVPGRGVLYMAPSLIVHYIDAHEYAPPREFMDAVMVCPEMRSADYLRAIREVGGAKLLKPAHLE